MIFAEEVRVRHSHFASLGYFVRQHDSFGCCPCDFFQDEANTRLIDLLAGAEVCETDSALSAAGLGGASQCVETQWCQHIVSIAWALILGLMVESAWVLILGWMVEIACVLIVRGPLEGGCALLVKTVHLMPGAHPSFLEIQLGHKRTVQQRSVQTEEVEGLPNAANLDEDQVASQSLCHFH